MGSLIGFRVIGQIKPLLQPSFSQTGEKCCQYQDDPYFFADKYQNFHFLYPFLSLRSGTKRYENVFLSLFFLYSSSYRELGILQITGR